MCRLTKSSELPSIPGPGLKVERIGDLRLLEEDLRGL